MKYQIDQSGKVEQTNKYTVVAFSNSTHGSIIISAVDKQKLLRVFRKYGNPRSFVIQTFVVLLYLLIKKHINKSFIFEIDKEYPGYENLIKSYLVQLINKNKKIKFPPENITYSLVGKKSQAHIIANRGLYLKKADIKVSTKEILELVSILENKKSGAL